MLGLILLLAVAYACARGIESAAGEISKGHKKRMAKAAKKNGRSAGRTAAAWTATAATAAGTFAKGFHRGFKREWPKAKERARARARFDKNHAPPAIGDDIGTDGAPVGVRHQTAREPLPKRPAEATGRPRDTDRTSTPDEDDRKLHLVKDDTRKTPTTGDPMALANIPEITGVETLKSAVARTASESTTTAEEAGAIAQRAQEELAATEAMIEQATALEFDEDGGTIDELVALRDQAQAALGAAQALQTAMVDKAAIAAQSSKNIHDRHGVIQEAVAANGGRMASKQAYTADA